jgi:NTP pyrophosphatase (non-canonical NTP hydrolase)
MTINKAQSQVDQWIKTIGVKYYSELTNLGILMEEVGELSRHIVRIYGEQSYRKEANTPSPSVEERRAQLSDEMADVLWVLICLANQTGVNLTEALQKNFEKKTLRDSERHKQNDKLT